MSWCVGVVTLPSPLTPTPQWFGFYKAGQDKQVYTLQESELYQEVGGAMGGVMGG